MKFNFFPSKLIAFIHKPNSSFEIESSSYFNKLKEFLIFDIKVLIALGIIITILAFLSEDFSMVFDSRIRSDYSSSIKMFLYFLTSAIIEEVAFRLGLKINRRNVSISLGFQIIIFLILVDIIKVSLLMKIALMLFSSGIIYLIINTKVLNFFTKNLNFYIFYNIIVFGLIHMFNYSYFNPHHYFYLPVLIFFPLILGSYLSYIRLKYSFIIALSFHVFHNLILLSFSTLLTYLIGY